MSEENTTTEKKDAAPANDVAPANKNTAPARNGTATRGPASRQGGRRGGPGGPASPGSRQGGRRGGPGGRRGGPGGRRRKREVSALLQEFDQKVLDIARVARVTAGGRRFSFRVTVVLGDHKGRVGVGVDKGKDVALAIEKAGRAAKKNMITVPITKDGTIPYEISGKQTSAVVFLRPARKGRGIIAGGAVRVVCSLVGFTDISAKMLGRSNNKLNNALATIEAFKSISVKEPIHADASTTTEK